MELLNENLSGGIRLSRVAEECGLSISHFCQVIQGELRCLHSPMARAAPG